MISIIDNEIQSQDNKLHCNYLGIDKKQNPKWGGWKIIAKYKSQGTDIKDIQDERLDLLVRNFYYLEFIKQN